MTSPIQTCISEDVKAAMRAREKQRLAALRLISSEFKKVEVDERIELDDVRVLAILDKMTKQRRDSLAQYESAGRADLVAQEQFEIDLIAEYLPAQLGQAELAELVAATIKELGAESMADMGKVMGNLKPRVQGRADMSEVGALVKAGLS
ncbi:MAG: GatB/YqeY domain-containing protein [Proteobacteria bacterium]|jgi:uncharacterized protein YqeY|nr:GatB/YqeY domain-containing protein [Pseudomonadota bacterium]